MKHCKDCGLEGEAELFPKAGKLCKACRNKVARIAYQKRTTDIEAKICKECLLQRPIDEFEKKGKSNRCKPCGAAYALKRLRAKKALEPIKEVILPKEGMKFCSDCKIEKLLSMFDKKRNQCHPCKNKVRNIRNKSRRPVKEIPIYPEGMNRCYACEIIKPINMFRPKSKSNGHLNQCKDCYNSYQRLQRSNMGEEGRNQEREKRNNPTNRERLRKNNRSSSRKRRLIDPWFRARSYSSSKISTYLKDIGSSKNGESCLFYLPFTKLEYIAHIETWFSHPSNLTPDGKVWMHWGNQGVYRVKNWKDNDPTTWVWQLDHIIPHSTFRYLKMGDPEFLKCWALSNLRPLSAKQNVMDGNRRSEQNDISSE